MALVAAVFATLWRRSVLETRRAEASKLVALAQAQLETDPTEALAFAVAYAIICAVLSTVGGIVCRVPARIRHGGDGALEPPDATEEL